MAIKRSDYKTNDDYLAALAVEKAKKNAQKKSKDKSNVTEVTENKKTAKKTSNTTKKKASNTSKTKGQSGTTTYTKHTFNPLDITKITIKKPEKYNDKYWSTREKAAKAIKNQKDLKLESEKAIADNEKYIAQRDALLDSLANGTYYNPDTDPMAQQYRKDYTRNGRQAMADTMARLSAQTGGLADSYAGAMAAQAYNNYMDELGSKLNIDLRKYAEDLVRNNADDYNKYNEAYVQRQRDNNSVIGRNNQYRTNEYEAKSAKNQNAYNAYRDLSETGYGRYQGELADYYNELESWLKMNGFAEGYREFNENLAENSRQFDADLAYKYAALAAQQAQQAMPSMRTTGGGGGGGGSSTSTSNTNYSWQSPNYSAPEQSDRVWVGGTSLGRSEALQGEAEGWLQKDADGNWSEVAQYDDRGYKKNNPYLT